MEFKVGDTVRIRNDLKADQRYGFHIANQDMVNVGGDLYTIEEILAFPDHITYRLEGSYWAWTEEMLEPADNIVRMADGTIIGDFSTGGFCDGFRGGKIPVVNDLIVSHTEMERTMNELSDALSAWATNVQLDKETVFNGLSQVLKRATEVYSSTKEEKNLKFTFYTNDWTDIDKSNGKKIPMRTTYAFTDEIKADTDCSVAEYDERIGCLIAAAKISAKKSSEAKMMYNIARNTWGTELSWAILFELANAACSGNFERIYKKFHNDNERFEKKRFTCTYCGKIFNTVEEKQAHEAWHIERRKARHERYLLRKRAKEIAFEEQAQKMAKEMMGEQK